MNIIPETVVRAVCWTLLHSLWQGLIFAAVAGIVMVMTKKASSSLRYNLLCSLMIFFLAASGYTFYRQLQVPGTSHTVALSADRLAANPDVASPIAASHDAASTNTATPDFASPVIPSIIGSLVHYFNTHAALVVVVWFILFLARFVKMLSGWVYVQRIRHYRTSTAPPDWQHRLNQLLDKLKITRPVTLLESALVKVPVVVGLLKPVILVPIGMLTHLSIQQVESILLHELAHIRRRDYLFNLVQHLIDTLFFFNPALVWVSSLIRAERENCCDDIAIRETRSRRQLIEALVSFHEYRQSVQGYAVCFTGKDSQVLQRVKRIVHRKNHSLQTFERVLLVTGLLVLGAAFVTINSSRPAPAPKKAPASEVHHIAVTAPQPGTSAPQSTTTIRQSKSQAKVQPVHGTQPLMQEASYPVPQTIEEKDTTPHVEYLGFADISIEKIIKCKEHGVTAEFVQSLRKLGYTDITPDLAIRLRDHGVDANFIRLWQSLGYKEMSLDEAIRLRDHGVDADLIQRLNSLGFPEVSLEMATRLVDHGVTTEYIAAFTKRIGKRLELGDYIKIKDAGISPTEIE